MKTNRVLILNPPFDRICGRDYYCSWISLVRDFSVPLDLLVLSGTLSKEFEISVIDAIASGLDYKECYQEIMRQDFDAIVFITGGVSWWKDFQLLAEIKKQKKDAVFIGSGDRLLFRGPEVMEECGFLDGILLDFTTSDVLDYLRNGKEVNNMIYRRDGEVVIGSRTQQSGTFGYPVPRHELFPIKRYVDRLARRKPISAIITDFGCPFRCSFCAGQGLKPKYRDVDNAMEELNYIASLGIKELRFRDFTFGSNQRNSINLCKRMIADKLDISWFASSRVDRLSEELLYFMKKAGCHTLLLGVENASDEVLAQYDKRITVEQTKRAFELCRKYKIKAGGYFILGLPGETKETVKRTISFARELDCDHAVFSTAVATMGSLLREEAINKQWINKNKDEKYTFQFPNAGQFTVEEITKLRKKAVWQFYFRPSYIFRRLSRLSDWWELRRSILYGIKSLSLMLRGKGRWIEELRDGPERV